MLPRDPNFFGKISRWYLIGSYISSSSCTSNASAKQQPTSTIGKDTDRREASLHPRSSHSTHNNKQSFQVLCMFPCFTFSRCCVLLRLDQTFQIYLEDKQNFPSTPLPRRLRCECFMNSTPHSWNNILPCWDTSWERWVRYRAATSGLRCGPRAHREPNFTS